MKNFIPVAACLFLASACNQAELTQSKHQNDSLTAVLNERDSTVNYFISSFNEVEGNLDSVTVRQQIIATNAEKGGGDLKQSQKDRINAEIAAINNLMDENRKKIAALNRRMKSSTTKNAELEKAMADLNSRLAEKDNQLTALNQQLTALNAQVTQLQTSVDTLTASNTAKTQTINDETTALHTAYYVIGKSSELRDAKVIDSKGGLLGIGKTAEMSPNVDKSKFTQIDYTQMGTIPVNANGAKIITSHPTDSYTIERDTKNKNKVIDIVITNPDKFWSESKYLVIVRD